MPVVIYQVLRDSCVYVPSTLDDDDDGGVALLGVDAAGVVGIVSVVAVVAIVELALLLL